MKTNKVISLFAACGLVLGCSAEEMRAVALNGTANGLSSTVDGKMYNLTSEEARALVGGDAIPRRAEFNTLAAQKLPRPIFATHDDAEIEATLSQSLSAVAGLSAEKVGISKNDGELVSSSADGFAVIAKTTGTLVAKKLNVPHTVTSVADAEEAVDLALAGVAKSGLIQLAKNETLDVVGVASTHYAGWVDNGGEELEPVYFSDPSISDPVTEFKSDYTVYFGRRYRGVPIIGPTLGVRLDANGEMVAFMKGWRDIAGETAAVSVLDSKAVTADKVSAADDSLAFRGASCGFTEGTDPVQTAAGIGCSILYDNPDAAGTLAAEKVELVSLAADSSIALGIDADDAESEPLSTEDESPAPTGADDIPE